MRRNFDEIDVALLNELQINASRSIKQLSVKASTSSATVHRRREELRSDGVIIGVAAQVDQRAVGRPLTFIVSVETSTNHPDDLEILRSWINLEPAFQQAFAMAGSLNLLLIVTARTSDEFGALLDRFQRENSIIKRAVPQLALETFLARDHRLQISAGRDLRDNCTARITPDSYSRCRLSVIIFS